MANELKLLAERGGYQLYSYDGVVHSLSGNIPCPIIETVKSGDKLKFFVSPESYAIEQSKEDPLIYLINWTIREIDSCGFRNEQVDGSVERIEFAGDTLEETIRNLKTRTDPYTSSGAHYNNYGRVGGSVNFFGASDSDLYTNPLAGLPIGLIQARLKQQEEFRCASKVNRVLFDIFGESERDYQKLIEQIRKGNKESIKRIVDGVTRLYGCLHSECDSEFISNISQKVASNELEYERLQTNLDIRNYLQSRIAK